MRARIEIEIATGALHPRNDKWGRLSCHCEASAHTGCGNLKPPNLYKPVRFLRLPLRGRMGHAPSLHALIEATVRNKKAHKLSPLCQTTQGGDFSWSIRKSRRFATATCTTRSCRRSTAVRPATAPSSTSARRPCRKTTSPASGENVGSACTRLPRRCAPRNDMDGSACTWRAESSRPTVGVSIDGCRDGACPIRSVKRRTV